MIGILASQVKSVLGSRSHSLSAFPIAFARVLSYFLYAVWVTWGTPTVALNSLAGIFTFPLAFPDLKPHLCQLEKIRMCFKHRIVIPAHNFWKTGPLDKVFWGYSVEPWIFEKMNPVFNFLYRKVRITDIVALSN